MAERRKAARAQELISLSLIKQDSIGDTSSLYSAKLINSSELQNMVFKAGDAVENVWTFKNVSN